MFPDVGPRFPRLEASEAGEEASAGNPDKPVLLPHGPAGIWGLLKIPNSVGGGTGDGRGREGQRESWEVHVSVNAKL